MELSAPLLQTDNHTSTSPVCFLQAGCPSCCTIMILPTASTHLNPALVGIAIPASVFLVDSAQTSVHCTCTAGQQTVGGSSSDQTVTFLFFYTARSEVHDWTGIRTGSSSSNRYLFRLKMFSKCVSIADPSKRRWKDRKWAENITTGGDNTPITLSSPQRTALLLNVILLPGCFLKTFIDITFFSLLFYLSRPTSLFTCIVYYSPFSKLYLGCSLSTIIKVIFDLMWLTGRAVRVTEVFCVRRNDEKSASMIKHFVWKSRRCKLLISYSPGVAVSPGERQLQVSLLRCDTRARSWHCRNHFSPAPTWLTIHLCTCTATHPGIS